MPVERSIAGKHCLMSAQDGIQLPIFWLMAEIRDSTLIITSLIAKSPTITLMKSTPASSCGNPKVSRAAPVRGSWPMREVVSPMAMEITPLRRARPERLMISVSAMNMRAKYSGGSEDHGDVGQQRREEGEADQAERSRDKGGDGADGKRRAGLPLLGHLVAVDGGRHGGRLPGDVDDDRGRRPPVHGAVIDGGHHDDRRRRGKHRGQGKEDRDPGGGTDAGEHADQRPDEAADQRPHEILQDKAVTNPWYR